MIDLLKHLILFFSFEKGKIKIVPRVDAMLLLHPLFYNHGNLARYANRE
jgi:hypothetical protein